MENEGRNMAFDDSNKVQMTIPERITLSAGYDGDENRDHSTRPPPALGSTSFDETPLVDPELVMAGMPTPPSVLTIDHSSANSYHGGGGGAAAGTSFVSSSPNWHTEGDGADDDESETSLHKYTRLRGGPGHRGNDLTSDHDFDDTTTSVVHPGFSTTTASRSIEIAGRESNMDEDSVTLDDAATMQRLCTNLQHRLTEVEKGLEHQNRVANVWRISLLTLTVIYPFLVHYWFGGRRR